MQFINFLHYLKTIERVKQLEDQLKQKENFINVLKTTNPAVRITFKKNLFFFKFMWLRC